MLQPLDTIVEEDEDEEIPQIISAEFFGSVQYKIQNVIKELREKEQYQLASEFIRLLAVAENIQISLTDEQTKNQQLSEQFVDASGRIEAALKISQKDQDTIKSLRNEVMETWKFSDLSKAREAEMAERLSEAQEKLGKAQQELESFERIIEDTGKMNPLNMFWSPFSGNFRKYVNSKSRCLSNFHVASSDYF